VPRAAALDVSGNFGGGNARTDSWTDVHRRTNTWDLEADLALSGTAGRRGLFRWLAGYDWSTLRTNYYPGFERTDAYGMRLRTSMFNNTSVPMSFGIAREWANFLSQREVERTGGVLLHTLAGSASVLVRGYPTLQLHASRVDFRRVALGEPMTEGDNETLSAGLAHSTSNHAYSLDYSTGWNHGSYVDQNYQSHHLNFGFTASPTDRTRFRLRQRYYLREPTLRAPENPRQEDTSVGAGVAWRPSQRTTAFSDYAYRHMLITAPATQTAEQIGHVVTQGATYRLSPEVGTQATIGLQYGEARLGSERRRSFGQNVGTGVNWQRPIGAGSLSAGANGSVGVTEPAEGDTTGSWGAGGSAGWGFGTRGTYMSAGYSASASGDLAIAPGLTIDHRVQFNGSHALAERMALRETIVYHLTRREDPLFGTGQSRSLSASAGLAWRRYTADIGGGMNEGLSEALAPPGEERPIIPVLQLDSRTVFATISLTQAYLGGSLRFQQLARTLRTSGPGRPDQFEHGGFASVSYSIGAWTLSLDDRISHGGTNGITQTVNVVMARFSRAFGGRFL